MTMPIQTPRELATRLRENAVGCENTAKDLPPAQRTRLLELAENYWQLADKIDQPKVRPGSLAKVLSLMSRDVADHHQPRYKRHKGW
jgi:hypothetical protein